MNYFSTGLDPTLESELLEAFQYIDKDKDGVIRPDEMLNLYHVLGQRATLEEVKTNMSRLSSNQSGRITVVDFMNILGRSLSTRSCEYELPEVFKLLDRNGDGYISPEELAQRLTAVMETTTREEALIILESIDVDGDKQISLEEFMALMRSGFVKKTDNTGQNNPTETKTDAR
ncbi:hypothetical protein P879_06954 [Paragonimus westermani]|uniref:EF-hand domain-containing protein n=1 Tax=Paragonimus westermani TaxID=34504 RepID=A0A8T0DHW5_9TREM|nr:hypothetical protein P879_06954 [Paragonimus westermani]